MRNPPVIYEEGNDDGRPIPTKWVICTRCEGHGHSSGYLGAFTAEQMHDDPDFAEDYMAGRYDRTCDECGGSGKVEVPDYKRMSKADRKLFQEQERERYECDAIQRQERLFEGGWREEGWFGE